MPTSASGFWQVATWVTGEICVYLTVRNSPGVGGRGVVGSGGGVGGRGGVGGEGWNFLS